MTKPRISSGGIDLIAVPSQVDLLGLVNVTSIRHSERDDSASYVTSYSPVKRFHMEGVPGEFFIDEIPKSASNDVTILNQELENHNLYIANVSLENPSRPVSEATYSSSGKALDHFIYYMLHGDLYTQKGVKNPFR